jgi:hypothetical protein
MEKKSLILILIAILILGFCFYWFSYRPTNTRKNCYEQAQNKQQQDYSAWLNSPAFTQPDFKKLSSDYYSDCLMRFGIK